MGEGCIFIGAFLVLSPSDIEKSRGRLIDRELTISVSHIAHVGMLAHVQGLSPGKYIFCSRSRTNVLSKYPPTRANKEGVRPLDL